MSIHHVDEHLAVVLHHLGWVKAACKEQLDPFDVVVCAVPAGSFQWGRGRKHRRARSCDGSVPAPEEERRAGWRGLSLLGHVKVVPCAVHHVKEVRKLVHEQAIKVGVDKVIGAHVG